MATDKNRHRDRPIHIANIRTALSSRGFLEQEIQKVQEQFQSRLVRYQKGKLIGTESIFLVCVSFDRIRRICKVGIMTVQEGFDRLSDVEQKTYLRGMAEAKSYRDLKK